MAAPLSPKLPWELANPLWAQAVNPVLANPIIQGRQILNIVLAATTPLTINHGLNRMMQGWIVVDSTASASVWRTQPLNYNTLTIEASAATTLALWVY